MSNDLAMTRPGNAGLRFIQNEGCSLLRQALSPSNTNKIVVKRPSVSLPKDTPMSDVNKLILQSGENFYLYNNNLIKDLDSNPEIIINDAVVIANVNKEAKHFVPKTPVKQNHELPMNSKDPLTPTTNLKLLTHLASLENTENNGQNANKASVGKENGNADPIKNVRRKDKSLGVLCGKFIKNYPEYPDVDSFIEVGLDAVAQSLQVERRRVYDIVNVLESVEIMVRLAKNRYLWHGKRHLKETLAKLKLAAAEEKIAEQMKNIKEEESLIVSLPEISNSNDLSNVDSAISSNSGKREKSLAMMSQTFLMLFLVSKPRIVNLDLAARMLIGEGDVNKKGNTQFKTKVRRLYDIANILTSLNLIRKINVSEVKGRKPAFEYIGPDIDDYDNDNKSDLKSVMSDLTNSQPEMQLKNSNLKRILLDGGENLYKRRLKFPRTKSENNLNANKGKKSFVRHSSFQEICDVAEQQLVEINKTEHGKTNNSAHSSLNGSILRPKNITSNSIVNSLGCTKQNTTDGTHVLTSNDGTPLLLFSGGQTFRLVLAPQQIVAAGSQSVPSVPFSLNSNVFPAATGLVRVPLVIEVRPQQSIMKTSNTSISQDNQSSSSLGVKTIPIASCSNRVEIVPSGSNVVPHIAQSSKSESNACLNESKIITS